MCQALPRERTKIDYAKTLQKKFAHMPEIRKISKYVHEQRRASPCSSLKWLFLLLFALPCRHRHVPKYIVNTKKRQRVVDDSKRRKEENVRKHSKPGSFTKEREKKRHIVAETE